MNRPATIALIAIVLASGGASAGGKAPPTSSPSAKPSSRKAAASYTCPMHPDVKSAKPGKCPKCGMNLVPKKNGTGGAK